MAMDLPRIVLDVAEKASLVASAALLAVWVRPLRLRLLGIGGRRDKVLAMLLGILISIWGAELGFSWQGQDVNLRAIGVCIAAVLGGRKAGVGSGLFAGLYYVLVVRPETAPWALFASLFDGLVLGLLTHRRPGALVHGGKAFLAALLVQLAHVSLVALGILIVSGEAAFVQQAAAWPAHTLKLLANALGVGLFASVARLALAREESVVEAAEARAAAEKARLEALRQRLEPHFLFNALNALRATIRRDPQSARELVDDLADLYRYVLSHHDDVALRDEVGHALAYLSIERVRLGEERLDVDVRVPGELEGARVPALLLQPLVENAVKHGVARRRGRGRVSIVARREGDWLQVEVEDRLVERSHRPSVRSIGEERGEGMGLGLHTLRERLRRRYGRDVGPELDRGETRTRVTVRLPWQEPAWLGERVR